MATPKKCAYQDQRITEKRPAPAPVAAAPQLTYDFLVMALLEKSESLAQELNTLMDRLARVCHPESIDPVASIGSPEIAEALQPLASVVDRFECMIQRVNQLKARLQI